MGCNNSPLESLAAFSIAFVAGAVSVAVLGKYIEKLRLQARTA